MCSRWPGLPDGHGDPRELHPDVMETDSLMQSPAKRVHCCECWRHTDNMRRDGDLIHEAVAIVVNASTLAVENSEAFKAADAFLAEKFRPARQATIPEAPRW